MAITPNHDNLGRDLCVALGLGDKHVVSIDLHVKVNEMITATVMYDCTETETRDVIRVLQRYTLEPLPDSLTEEVLV